MRESSAIYNDEAAPYRKKARHNAPKKSKHKHKYQPCVFEYDGVQLDKAHGFIPKKETGFGSYCTVCGKIGGSTSEKWTRWVPLNGGPAGRSEYTDEAKVELNPATRTLPTFRIDDIFSQKFISVGTGVPKERKGY